jgi:hypothetical protein
MMHTRRQFIRTVQAFGAFATTQGPRKLIDDQTWPPPPPPAGQPVDDSFPSHHPALAREMVAVSHGNIARVRELLTRHRELAKASWDWGYGDWETALGAASHVGNRAIAELLLAHGAPPTHFSAAMLAQLEVLNAFFAATPGLQRMRGPHGLTLMVHAKNGGPQAAGVVALLESLGGANAPYRDEALTADERASLAGRYTFGDRPRDMFVVSDEPGALMVARAGAAARALFHQGQFRFHAAGAEGVAIRFEREDATTIALVVADPDVVVRAKKIG